MFLITRVVHLHNNFASTDLFLIGKLMNETNVIKWMDYDVWCKEIQNSDILSV